MTCKSHNYTMAKSCSLHITGRVFLTFEFLLLSLDVNVCDNVSACDNVNVCDNLSVCNNLNACES